MAGRAPAPRDSNPFRPGDEFSLIATGSAFDVRRSEVLCSSCACPVGFGSHLVVDASGRWSHKACHDKVRAWLEAKAER